MSLSKARIGNVIGERRLVVPDAPGKKLVVTLGKPRRMKSHEDWECPFQIDGPGVTRLEFRYGVDALQARSRQHWKEYAYCSTR